MTANEVAEAGFTVSATQASPEAFPESKAPFSQSAHIQRGAPSGCTEIRLGFLPTLNLQREAPSIFMCGPVSRRDNQLIFGSDVFKGCDSKDRVLLDERMLGYSLGFARQIVPAKFAAAICTSVSYETLAWSRGRQVYQNALRSAGAANMPFLIVKIDDVPPGTPCSRLAEIVATVRPFVKRVFVQLPNSDVGLMQSGNIGAAGLCAALPANATPPAIVRLATWLNRTAMVQQAVSCVDAVETPLALPLLRAAGIRFATGRPDDNSIHLDFPSGGECVSPACAA